MGIYEKTDPLCMNLYAGGTGKIESLNTNQNKSIKQYDLTGKYIRTWNSIKEAALFYSKSKKSPDTLSATLTHKNKAKTFKGYQWRYFTGNTNDINSIKYGK